MESNVRDELKSVHGLLEIHVTNILSGKVERIVKIDNLIVSNFAAQEALALAGNTLADRVINRIQVGTSGTAPAVTDNAITGAVNVVITSTTYPTGKSIQFVGTLGSGDGNGVTYQEAGLLFNDATLAARQVFAGMAKSSAFAWTITWTITWS